MASFALYPWFQRIFNFCIQDGIAFYRTWFRDEPYIVIRQKKQLTQKPPPFVMNVMTFLHLDLSHGYLFRGCNLDLK